MLENIKNICGRKVATAGLVAGSLVASSSAWATGESQSAAAFTALSAKVTELEGQAWPVVIAVFVAMAGITLFKKFGGKAI